MNSIHDPLTESVIGMAFEVINELGAGFLESVYEQALMVALLEKGYQVERQVAIKVYFHGQEVGSFFADLLINQELIVELKCVKVLVSEHKAQLINYLKASRLNKGLLINFGNQKLEIKRLYG